MEVKLQGFYSTVIRFIETYNEKIDQCVNIVSQIQEHEKQLQSCENVNPLDFKIDSINFKIKASLLQKLQDILSQKNIDLTVLVSNFQTNSDLLKKKLEKCIEVKFRPEKENVELGQFFSWAFEICDIFEKHALKCEYLLQNRHQLGMISNKKSLITIFGNKHEIKNFIKENLKFFMKRFNGLWILVYIWNKIANFESKLY